MHILHIAAECYPAAKTGGLGDVVGALPKYLNKAGHVAQVIIPAYHTKYSKSRAWKAEHEGYVTVREYKYKYHVLKCGDTTLGYDLFVIDIENFFHTEEIYTSNDVWRFTLFQRAAVEWVNTWDALPDIIHCHDHHAALIPFFMQESKGFERLSQIPSVFTIHNGLYQGAFSWDNYFLLPPYDNWKWGMLDWNKLINPMAAAIKCSWAFTTVSIGYMHELMVWNNGLEPLINEESHKAHGILNGIDAEVWDPATDSALHANYSADNAQAGKWENKKQVCEVFGLSPHKPLFCFIGRLVPEKGTDLLAEAISKAVQDTEGTANFVVLGSGDSAIERSLNALKGYMPDNVNCYIGYNENLSHKMYAASDFLLMPSRMEPCGLNQMYAMRYGTIPIVGAVGGLNDTVIDISEADGFGIKHAPGSVDAIRYSIQRAMQVYADANYMQHLCTHIMNIDHSWNKAAQNYISLYQKLITV